MFQGISLFFVLVGEEDIFQASKPAEKESKMKKRIFLAVTLVLSFSFVTPAFAETAGLEDLDVPQEGYWNGSDGSGGFQSDGAFFENNYNLDFDSWDGFAYSNLTDTEASGFSAQYNAIAGSGAEGTETYAIGYVSSFAASPPTITLEEAQEVEGAYFTNNNYAYYSMKEGDQFAKKFTEDDWFELTITGLDEEENETGQVKFRLADGTNIIDSWQWVDLAELGTVKQLTFTLDSTDKGEFGINTPTYFAMDQLVIDDDHDFEIGPDAYDDSSCFINSMSMGSFLRK